MFSSPSRQTTPTGKVEVVTYRRRKTNEALARCQARLPGETVGIPKSHPPQPVRTPYVPPAGGSASTRLIHEKDAKIEQLRGEKDQLLGRLQNTQIDLEKTLQDLRRSEIAKDTLRKSLKQAQEQLRTTDLDPAAVKRLEGEVKRLTNELAIADDALAAADKRNAELASKLQSAKDIIESLHTERDELIRERDRMEDLLKGGNDDDIKRLLAENSSLKKELAAAQAEAKKLSSEKKRDSAQIAALRERLSTVEGRLAELQEENASYQNRIAALSDKLRSTEAKLAQGVGGGADNKLMVAAAEENKALRAIVKRQIMQQAWRKEAKELVMAELVRSGEASRGPDRQHRAARRRGDGFHARRAGTPPPQRLPGRRLHPTREPRARQVSRAGR